MIFFDGVSLESIADVKIEDIRVSPIKYDPVARPRAISPGSQFIRNRQGERTVAITFALLDENDINRQKALIAISQWAKSDKEYRLDLPGWPEYFLMCVCTAKPEPSLRQWFESKLRLVFTCINDPFWNTKAEKSVACGTSFFVQGDAAPHMRIERTLSGSASNQSYSLDGNTMTFSTIPAGNMVINLDPDVQTAVVGNTNIMQYYSVNGRFLIPRKGLQTITGTGTVKYRERWE